MLFGSDGERKRFSLMSWHRKLKGHCWWCSQKLPHTAITFFKMQRMQKHRKKYERNFKKKIRSQQFGTLREDLNPSSVRGQGWAAQRCLCSTESRPRFGFIRRECSKERDNSHLQLPLQGVGSAVCASRVSAVTNTFLFVCSPASPGQYVGCDGNGVVWPKIAAWAGAFSCQNCLFSSPLGAVSIHSTICFPRMQICRIGAVF